MYLGTHSFTLVQYNLQLSSQTGFKGSTQVLQSLHPRAAGAWRRPHLREMMCKPQLLRDGNRDNERVKLLLAQAVGDLIENCGHTHPPLQPS